MLNLFFLWGIVILILGLLFVYYKLKRKKDIDGLVFVTNSILSFFLKFINKTFKTTFTAITNPFTLRIHLTNYKDYCNIQTYDTLYKHEYIHTLQIKKLKPLKFIILYILHSFKGYKNNKYELEAQFLENNTIDEINKYFEGK